MGDTRNRKTKCHAHLIAENNATWGDNLLATFSIKGQPSQPLNALRPPPTAPFSSRCQCIKLFPLQGTRQEK